MPQNIFSDDADSCQLLLMWNIFVSQYECSVTECISVLFIYSISPCYAVLHFCDCSPSRGSPSSCFFTPFTTRGGFPGIVLASKYSNYRYPCLNWFTQSGESGTVQVSAHVLENKTLLSVCFRKESTRKKRFSELSEQYEVVIPVTNQGASGVTEVLSCWKRWVLRARRRPFSQRDWICIQQC